MNILNKNYMQVSEKMTGPIAFTESTVCRFEHSEGTMSFLEAQCQERTKGKLYDEAWWQHNICGSSMFRTRLYIYESMIQIMVIQCTENYMLLQ